MTRGAGQVRELRRLATFARDDGAAEVRWSFDELTSERREPAKFISGRKWIDKDGQFIPTRAGLTVRLSELDELVAALQRVQRARRSRLLASPSEQSAKAAAGARARWVSIISRASRHAPPELIPRAGRAEAFPFLPCL